MIEGAIIALVVWLFAYNMGKWKALDGLVEICPRATNLDGTPTGFDCRGNKVLSADDPHTCEQRHIWRPRDWRV